jgi:hypothetical protein
VLEAEPVPRKLREILFELLDVGSINKHDATVSLGQDRVVPGPSGGGVWVRSSWEGRTGLLTVGDMSCVPAASRALTEEEFVVRIRSL